MDGTVIELDCGLCTGGSRVYPRHGGRYHDALDSLSTNHALVIGSSSPFLSQWITTSNFSPFFKALEMCLKRDICKTFRNDSKGDGGNLVDVPWKTPAPRTLHPVCRCKTTFGDDPATVNSKEDMRCLTKTSGMLSKRGAGTGERTTVTGTPRQCLAAGNGGGGEHRRVQAICAWMF